MGKGGIGPNDREHWPGATTPDWDSTDEASWESFPASDPPAVGAVSPPGRHAEPHRQALYDALDDEHRAWATYDQVILDFGDALPFNELREAVARHIETLRALVRRCGLDVPENPWAGRVPRYASTHEACEASVAAAVARVERYQRLVQTTTRRDVLEVLGELQRALQERHLPALRHHVAGDDA